MDTSPSPITEYLMDEYTRLLIQFDWAFQIQPVHQEERQTRQQLQRMWSLQQALDPDGAIWRRYRPEYGPEPIAPPQALVASRHRKFP